MDTNEMKREIIHALETGLRGKWVSPAVAIRKIPNSHTVEAFDALNELIQDRLVEYETKGGYQFIRYNPLRPKPNLRIV